MFVFDEDDDGEKKRRNKKEEKAAKTWQNYVRRTWLESACGEVSYLVNRYDAATGKRRL